MDWSRFENLTFDTLPDKITASVFENCIFNVGSRFERCNLLNCVVNQPCYFDRSNILVCTGDGLDSSTYEKSNRQDEEEPEISSLEV